jgi:hypothetical protein
MSLSRNKSIAAVLLLVRLALGAVFVYAAWVKLREPWLLFAISIDNYQLLPQWGVELVARTLPVAPGFDRRCVRAAGRLLFVDGPGLAARAENRLRLLWPGRSHLTGDAPAGRFPAGGGGAAGGSLLLAEIDPPAARGNGQPTHGCAPPRFRQPGLALASPTLAGQASACHAERR